MIAVSPNTIEDLVGIVISANTPRYLYKHFHRSEFVARLAETHSSEALVGIIRETQAKDLRSAEDIALAYACLIALTIRPSTKALPLLATLDAPSLAWSREIVEIHLSAFVPVAAIDVHVPTPTGSTTDTSSHARKDTRVKLALGASARMEAFPND